VKTLAIARKSLLQQSRDRLGLALTVLMAPLFVLLYWLLLEDGQRTQTVCLVADPEIAAAVAELAPRLTVTACPNPDAILRVRAPGLADAASSSAPLAVTVEGDASSPGFALAAQAVHQAIDVYVRISRGNEPATMLEVRALGRSGERTPFELYVPNLLVFAMIMLVFSSAMVTAREVERGTLERLRLTRMRPGEWIAGTAITQALLGACSVTLTFVFAMVLGFDARPAALPVAAGIALLTGIACIGIGTIVASTARSVAQAFAIASFFMFLLLLFSGVVFPIPELAMLEALPTVHGAQALHEVLVLDTGLADVLQELGALAGLSTAFFLLGGWRFSRLHHRFVHGGRS
jgi:ABC-2 type transport system permease protein